MLRQPALPAAHQRGGQSIAVGLDGGAPRGNPCGGMHSQQPCLAYCGRCSPAPPAACQAPQSNARSRQRLGLVKRRCCAGDCAPSVKSCRREGSHRLATVMGCAVHKPSCHRRMLGASLTRAAPAAPCPAQLEVQRDTPLLEQLATALGKLRQLSHGRSTPRALHARHERKGTAGRAPGLAQPCHRPLLRLPTRMRHRRHN